jgi:GTP cyclohydrolase IA
MDDVVKTLNMKKTTYDRPSRAEAEAAVRVLIRWAGDDPHREGLLDTPKRVAKSYESLFSGYHKDPNHDLERVFEEVQGYDELVIVRDIPFFSHCEHHLVPIIGKAHIGYYPRDGVVGLSKLARVVDIFARRMQTQEAMTAQIANAIDKTLNPIGLALLVEAEHMCMAMRGIQKHGVSTVTSQFTGKFKDEPAAQVNFFTQLRGLNG